MEIHPKHRDPTHRASLFLPDLDVCFNPSPDEDHPVNSVSTPGDGVYDKPLGGNKRGELMICPKGHGEVDKVGLDRYWCLSCGRYWLLKIMSARYKY